MRHIGELDNKQQTEAFLSYLLVKGIEGHFDDSGQGCDIWIKDEDQLQVALKELDEFRQSPDDPKYSASVADAKKIVREDAKRKKEAKKRIVTPANNNFSPKLVVTPIVIGICIVVALATNFGDSFDNAVYRFLAFTCVGPLSGEEMELARMTLDPDAISTRMMSIRRGEIWRLVTPVFIHFGITHIIFNLWMFGSYGSMIEKRYGPKKYGILLLLFAVVPVLVQCLVPISWDGSPPAITGNYIMTHLGGMSGVVYGVFGFVLIKAIYDPSSRMYVHEINVLIMLVWLVACIYGKELNDAGFTLVPANVANWAHGAGLAIGCLVGYFWPKK